MKVGLKETLSLLAAGYKKKDIDAMIAADEEEQEKSESGTQAPVTVPDPVPTNDYKPDPEPDYKKMYEELLEENKKTEAKVTKLQQDNVHKDSAPASLEAKQKQEEDLQNLFRSFM